MAAAVRRRVSQATFNYMIDAYLAFKFGEAGPEMTLSDLIDHDQKRTTLKALWQAYFTDVDVFLCPTTFTTAPPPDDRPIEERTIPTASGPRKYNDLALLDQPCVDRRAAGPDRAGRTRL